MKKNTLILIGLCLAIPSFAQWRPAGNRIKTQWAETLDSKNVLPEYPRPIMEREAWLNLNGLWDYTILPQGTQMPVTLKGKILVPFAIESSLSGVQRNVTEGVELWYKRTFFVPDEWNNQHILLHFGAVDWETEVYLNGQKIGTHAGGYTPFTFDITPYLQQGEQQLMVKVWDPTDEGYQPRGKQAQNPQAAFYSAVSGIWQTVWIEPVNRKHITAVNPGANIDRNQLTVDISTENTGHADKLEITVKAEGAVVAKNNGTAGESITLSIPDARLWSPEQPFLYDIEIRLYDKDVLVDEVKSYAAMRKIAIASDMYGKIRLQLNNAGYFQCGVMDQGYWPDGLYTAPTDEAMQFDIRKAKELGFNLIRKHQKVEPARWYTHCDRLGMLVWQDMPAGDYSIKNISASKRRSPESEDCFRKEWKEIMDFLKPYPSIVTWILFNEGWGQFKADHLAQWTKKHDPSRLVDPTAGRMQVEAGDIYDWHQYPVPFAQNIPQNSQRAIVLGEYGGITSLMPEHVWQLDNIFGYTRIQEPEDAATSYAMIAESIRGMISKGLTACSYTQLTDIEGELNGLITYDRRVVKVDEARMKEVNERLRNALKQK